MLNLMLSKIKRYLPFVKARIMDFLVYKWQVYGWILSDVVIAFIIYYLWSAIYASSNEPIINGFDQGSMITYLIISQITYQFTYCSDSFWIIGQEIRSGDISMNLIRPISYRLGILASTFGSFLISIIMIFLPLAIIAFIVLHLKLGIAIPSISNIGLYLLSCLLSLLIVDAFNFFFGLIAFFTQALFGAGMIKDAIVRFLSGALIPLAFFPLSLQKLFYFLPFASIVSTPNLILLNKLAPNEIISSLALQVMWIVILSILAKLGYNKAIKHIVAQGG